MGVVLPTPPIGTESRRNIIIGGPRTIWSSGIGTSPGQLDLWPHPGHTPSPLRWSPVPVYHELTGTDCERWPIERWWTNPAPSCRGEPSLVWEDSTGMGVVNGFNLSVFSLSKSLSSTRSLPEASWVTHGVRIVIRRRYCGYKTTKWLGTLHLPSPTLPSFITSPSPSCSCSPFPHTFLSFHSPPPLSLSRSLSLSLAL